MPADPRRINSWRTANPTTIAETGCQLKVERNRIIEKVKKYTG